MKLIFSSMNIPKNYFPPAADVKGKRAPTSLRRERRPSDIKKTFVC